MSSAVWGRGREGDAAAALNFDCVIDPIRCLRRKIDVAVECQRETAPIGRASRGVAVAVRGSSGVAGCGSEFQYERCGHKRRLSGSERGRRGGGGSIEWATFPVAMLRFSATMYRDEEAGRRSYYSSTAKGDFRGNPRGSFDNVHWGWYSHQRQLDARGNGFSDYRAIFPLWEIAALTTALPLIWLRIRMSGRSQCVARALSKMWLRPSRHARAVPGMWDNPAEKRNYFKLTH